MNRETLVTGKDSGITRQFYGLNRDLVKLVRPNQYDRGKDPLCLRRHGRGGAVGRPAGERVRDPEGAGGERHQGNQPELL